LSRVLPFQEFYFLKLLEWHSFLDEKTLAKALNPR